MTDPTARRNLSSSHFAFMRSLAQGLDLRASWNRYLALEGRDADLRVMKSTISWIRDAFAAAALRENRLGTARLVLIDPHAGEALSDDVPTLDEFAESRGLEDFSQAEREAAYTEEFGQASGADKRRRSLVRRQLIALQWLQSIASQNPGPGDHVGAWLAPALAKRLEGAGLPTLFALASRINGMGSSWYAAIPGIGAGKAERIREWVIEHQSTIGVQLGSHTRQRISTLTSAELAKVVPPSSALVPLEKFLAPAALDGSEGRYRAPRALCMLDASNDMQAVMTWLNTKRAGHAGALSHTQRSYRKEAERLVLWAVLERKKALSSLTADDAQAFAAFLADPPAAWCGARHQARWSPLWRPLEGALSPAALAHTITVLKGLYGYLASQSYLHGNPFESVPLPRVPRRRPGDGRSLPRTSIDRILELLPHLPATLTSQRRALAFRWLYATGLRRSEMIDARCGHLDRTEFMDGSGATAIGWIQRVTGKGEKHREVPLPADLIDSLSAQLVSAGCDPDPCALGNADIPILFSSRGDELTPLSDSLLYQNMKDLFARCADLLGQEHPAAAERLRKASAHWLRHSAASHAINPQPGFAGVAPHIVQGNLGHSSLDTTMGYVTTERDDRLRAMRSYWRSTSDRNASPKNDT